PTRRVSRRLLCGPEVSLRECATGTGFQIALESECLLFGRELNGNCKVPRTIGGCIPARPTVVPHQPSLWITRDSNVSRVGLTLENVYKSDVGLRRFIQPTVEIANFSI